MLLASIILLVKEFEWINPMVVRDKKSEGLCICVDLQNLNDACVHDLFPTPLTCEVLENRRKRGVLLYRWVFSIPPGKDCLRRKT